MVSSNFIRNTLRIAAVAVVGVMALGAGSAHAGYYYRYGYGPRYYGPVVGFRPA